MAGSTLLPMLASCAADELDFHDDGPVNTRTTICVKTAMEPGRHDKILSGEDPFMLILWENADHLETAGTTGWPNPYLVRESPQSVAFYSEFVYNVGEPYPSDSTQPLYATGFSPANAFTHSDFYRVLQFKTPAATDPDAKTAERTDFLGCDVWREVYRGSGIDPFAQEKNKLYFRHLAAKLIFYADRDTTMENKQFVRKVQITNLQMSIDGSEWTALCAPTEFTWGTLTPDDFSASYSALLDSIKRVSGNNGVTTVPKGGYRTSKVTAFAGKDSDFLLQKRLSDKTPATDRVPLTGMAIDSCYVASPLNEDGTVRKGHIRLKMDICAEMSFDPAFQMPDGTYTDAEGNTVTGTVTDNLTFTRGWKEVVLDAIKTVSVDDSGNPTETDTPVKLFKPGDEYRVYIHFSRTGVDIAARQLPWNRGGVHYIAIVGKDPTTPEGGSESGNEGGSENDEQTPTQTE